MAYKTLLTGFLFIFSIVFVYESAWGTLDIHAQSTVNIELIGYNGLTDSSLFAGRLSAKIKQEIVTPYRGLALLRFEQGQRYPVIIGDETFTLKITAPETLPSFADSAENEFFYRLLSGTKPEGTEYAFALLMIQAKQLLESSHSIHTTKQLTAKKNEFHKFVRDHYESLKHSDMVRRLLAQYFMMHEYVDYHTEGAPATDIQINYQKAVLNGVGSWLEILKSHLPEHDILNYCVSLYYNRSMVALASLIVSNYRNDAYCPGSEKKTISFPKDLLIVDANGNGDRQLETFKGKKIIAFVSDECPVSMVETIIKVRQLANQNKDVKVIIAPLEKLSGNHLIMNKMVSNGNMLFINDEKWRKDNLAKKINLPLFVPIGDDFE